jgi:probable HAF family extracellular repeat protein
MRALILFSGAALGLLACTSEETPAGPSTSARPEMAVAKAYTAVDLGTLGGGYSQPQAINSAGQVVGFSLTAGGADHAFLWEKGVMTDLGALGGGNSFATAINSADQIVGASETAGGEEHAFLWAKGVTTDLGTLGGIFSTATGINPRGLVVGFSELGAGVGPGGGAITHAFVWADGVMTDLGAHGSGASSYAFGINPAGQIVGVDGAQATLWTRK